MRTRDHEELAPLVNLADITEIELSSSSACAR